MRIRKKPWAEEELAQNDHVMKNAEALKGKWWEYFGNDNPIYVEIGCGKGGFIRKNAEAYPHINFVGIERNLSVVAVAARRTTEELPNLALVWDDAKKLSDFFEVGEFQRLYLNFSDPWPKARHAKRRLTHRNFLALYKQLLGEGGHLRFKTDNRALFDFSVEEFKEFGLQIIALSYDLHHSEYENPVETEYEQKFSALGTRINFCEVVF